MAAGRGICLKIYQNIDKMEEMHRITLNSAAEKVKKSLLLWWQRLIAGYI